MFVLYRMLYHWSSFFLFNWIVLSIFSAINGVCLGLVLEGLQTGQSYTSGDSCLKRLCVGRELNDVCRTYQDVLFVNMFVQFWLIFWDGGVWFYLVVHHRSRPTHPHTHRHIP